MEVYQERSWISNDPKVVKGPRYHRHRILPSRVIADYCPDETPTMASILASYNEEETISPEAPDQYANDEDGSFAWVAINADALYEQYPEQWILVDKAKVIGSASNPQELIQLAQSRGILEPFITKAGPPELPAKAVYSGQIV
jgi:uncharacterized protein DUF5678